MLHCSRHKEVGVLLLGDNSESKKSIVAYAYIYKKDFQLINFGLNIFNFITH